jgi:DNA-binding XRE family transcriptional regulator
VPVYQPPRQSLVIGLLRRPRVPATVLRMDEDVAGHLGNNIRQLREARGLTQQQIAKVAGVPRPTWANLESGAANPTLAVLIRVASALQV